MENDENTQKEQKEAPVKFNLSGVNHSLLNRDISKEIDFFSIQKDAMVDQVMMIFEDKLNGDDLLLLKKSLERTWDNGFRWASYNCD